MGEQSCGVTARDGVFVVGRSEDQHIPEISILNGPEELLAAVKLLELVFWHSEGEIHHLHPPHINRVTTAAMTFSTSHVPAGPKTSAEYSFTRGAIVRMMSATVVP